MPGFARMVWYYCTSPRVSRGVPDGRKQRQRLDLYVPKAADTFVPENNYPTFADEPDSKSGEPS